MISQAERDGQRLRLNLEFYYIMAWRRRATSSWDGDMAAPKRRWIACTCAHHCAMHSVCELAARPSCCGCRGVSVVDSTRLSACSWRVICSSVSLDTNSDTQNFPLHFWNFGMQPPIGAPIWCLGVCHPTQNNETYRLWRKWLTSQIKTQLLFFYLQQPRLACKACSIPRHN